MGTDLLQGLSTELGMLRVTRAVGAFGGGTSLNAKTARSQLQGGMIWGISMALFEHTVRDERNGRAVTRDRADYHLPVHADVPRARRDHGACATFLSPWTSCCEGEP